MNDMFYTREGSGRVMEKCGMKLEGISKQGDKVKNVFRDVVNYGIVKEDWKKLR